MKLLRSITLGINRNSFFSTEVKAYSGTQVEVLDKNTGNHTTMGGRKVLIRVNGVVKEVDQSDLGN
jgi:hypothetical protein